jgi:methanogenic corrinoid protein MtbC1
MESIGHVSSAADRERNRFLALILDGDRHRAEAYARQIFEERGVRFLYELVIQPALQDVGKLWYANRITVADEHLATAAAQSAVAALYPQFNWPPRGEPRVLVACAQGERHEFGARMVADMLALDGWDDRFLGADVPIADLAAHARKVAPSVVAISVTLPVHVPTAKAAIDLVRHARPGVKILIGGLATKDHPGVCDAFGADAFALSGSEAVEVVRGWK